jgi:nicotinate phosphoribosyltransferase
MRESPSSRRVPGKRTFPYKRQVWRFLKDGKFDYDKVSRFQEGGLVKKVSLPLPSLKEIRGRVLEQLNQLPEGLKSLRKKVEYKVEVDE